MQDFFITQRLGIQILFHELIIGFSAGFHEHEVQTIGFILILGRDVTLIVSAFIIKLESTGFHRDQVNNTLEFFGFTDRHIDRNRSTTEVFFHVIKSFEIIRAFAVELIDKSNQRDLKFFRPTP